eukprot:TRINITY_DN104400_c0_g1_i1.p1 TRINITY_DN104400_c0_g1~~TRINITY_DN104400_c0_g1_i1.p1  ORF type:complete len:236 (-),score=25.69 TRINITY_DN104400_c0_g1_i1:17-685(-)
MMEIASSRGGETLNTASTTSEGTLQSALSLVKRYMDAWRRTGLEGQRVVDVFAPAWYGLLSNQITMAVPTFNALTEAVNAYTYRWSVPRQIGPMVLQAVWVSAKKNPSIARPEAFTLLTNATKALAHGLVEFETYSTEAPYKCGSGGVVCDLTMQIHRDNAADFIDNNPEIDLPGGNKLNLPSNLLALAPALSADRYLDFYIHSYFQPIRLERHSKPSIRCC